MNELSSAFKEVGSANGKDVLAALSGEGSLLDGRLIALCVRSNSGLEVEMTFEPAPRVKYQRVRLEIHGVVQLQIWHSDEYVFGSIESIKLRCTTEGLYYISIDPDVSTPEPATADQDFVLGRSITAFFYEQVD